MRPNELVKLLAKTIPAKMPVLITGRPGIGKSEIVSQVCDQVGADLIISHPVVSDPVDYKGALFIDSNDEANFLPIGDLKKLLTATKLTVFFLDDLGQASTAVQSACMQLVLARQINGHKISDHVAFVSATNRREDRAGVGGFLEPLKSRFTIVNLEPTLDDWIDWALAQDWMPMELIGAVRFRPKWVTEWSPAKNHSIVNTPTPRNIAEIGRLMNLGLPREVQFSAFAGRLGEASATELMAFLDLYMNLPTPAQIASDPMGCPLPQNASAVYAILSSLVGRCDDATVNAYWTYASRVGEAMGTEYTVCFYSWLVRRNDGGANLINSCTGVVDWLQNYGHLLTDKAIFS